MNHQEDGPDVDRSLPAKGGAALGSNDRGP
jgi:hypothetical protein